MLSLSEIARSLTGAWRLFLNLPDGMGRFDLSVVGFWRSFAAVWLIVPFYFTVVAVNHQMLAETPEAAVLDARFWIARGITLAVDWVTFPAILAASAGFLGVVRTYPAFIVARNWAGVIEAVPAFLMSLMLAVGLLDAELYKTLSLALVFVILRYRFLIVRIALGVPALLNFGLVIADLLLSLLVDRAIDALVPAAAAAQ